MAACDVCEQYARTEALVCVMCETPARDCGEFCTFGDSHWFVCDDCREEDTDSDDDETQV